MIRLNRLRFADVSLASRPFFKALTENTFEPDLTCVFRHLIAGFTVIETYIQYSLKF